MVKALGYLAVLMLAAVVFGYPMLAVYMLLLFTFGCLMAFLAHGVYALADHDWYGVCGSLLAVMLIGMMLYGAITGMMGW